MLRAKRQVLRPTETIVRPLPVIQSGLEEEGISCLGGEIEEERHEDEEQTINAARRCAEQLRLAEHAVVYTGAGVSTSTGINDYRGPDGVWTSLATGRIPDDTFDYTDAVPSYTHMCIKKLIQTDYIKFCTSTNLDCLHCKSGLEPFENIAELHGNIHYERCSDCEAEVQRRFPIRRTKERFTGRRCDCGGAFTDSGVDFGQSLPKRQLNLATQEALKSDFSLVVGTSMRVRPASELPVMGARVKIVGTANAAAKMRMCMVNRMVTPLDENATIRSFGKVDTFFFHLMAELGLEPDAPPACCHLISKSEMRKLAAHFMPPSTGHYVGEEELERRTAAALSSLEAELC
jgi:mono-ADP-ribosyltransferase sirtuin 6